MTLQNLLGVSLDAVAPDRAQVGRLLTAAERNLADAGLAALSAENRFDAAYKSIMQLAMAALNANGYRTHQPTRTPPDGNSDFDPDRWTFPRHRSRSGCIAQTAKLD